MVKCHLNARRRVKTSSVAAAVAASLLAVASRVQAGNQTWSGGSLPDGNWSDIADWTGGAAPGAISGTTSTDIATFNTAIANTWGLTGTPIVIDQTTQNIGGINFDAAAGNYFIGTTGGNSLLLSSGGTIQILNTLTSTNAVETINAPLVIEGAGGTYTFANNSANGTGAGAGTLNIGGAITGGAAGATVLTLAGSNTNANTIGGIIGNGTATSLAITKTGAGTWLLSGANTYTGLTTIGNGTLILSGAAFSNTARSYSISSGAVLSLTGLSGTAAGAGTSEPNGAVTFSGAGTLQIAGGWLNNNTGPTAYAINMNMSATGLINIQSGTGIQNGGWQNITWTGNLAGLQDNGTLDLWDGKQAIVDALTGTGIVTSTGGGGNGIEVGINNGSGTFTGALNEGSGNWQFTKVGTGTQTLGGTTDNAGLGVTVSNGTLVLAKTSTSSVHAIGGDGATVNGGVLQLGGTGGDQIYDGATVNVTSGAFDTNGLNETFGTLKLAGTGISNAGALLNSASGTSTLTATTTLTANTTIGVTQSGGALILPNAISGSGFGLTKVGAGSLTLNGGNSYTGVTTVNAGTMTVSGAGSIASSTGLSVASGATFNYLPTTVGTMTLGAASTLTLAGGSTIGLEWNNTPANSEITVVGSASLTGSSPVIDFTLTGAYASGQTYTLLTASGGLGTAANYSIINPAINTTYAFTVGSGGTNVQLTPTALTSLSTEYWLGGLSGNPGAWTAYTGGLNPSASNWASDSSGTVTAVLPTSGTNVIFSAAGASNQSTMTLGGNMSILGLTVDGSTAPTETNPLTLAATGGYTLSIYANGITVNSGSAAISLGSNVTLAAPQTWTNNSTSTLTVGSGAAAVNNGTNLLTIAGTGATTITNFVGGTGGLTVSATGNPTVTLNGTTQIPASQTWTNSSSNGLSVNGILLNTGGNHTVTFSNTAATTIGANIDLSESQSTGRVLTFTGSGSSPLVLSGIIADSAAGVSTNSANSGLGIFPNGGSGNTVLISGTNTYSGTTTMGGNATGPITIGNASAFGTSTVLLDLTKILTNAPYTLANNFQSDGGNTNVFGGTNNLTINGTYTNNVAGAGLSNTGTGTLALAGNVYLSNVSGTGYTFTFSGSGPINVSGIVSNYTSAGGTAGGVAYSGSGKLTLNGTNTYTGATSINSGSVQFQGISLPSASAINLGAGTLQIRNDGAGSNGSISLGNSITLSGSVTGTIDTGNNGSSNTGNTVAFGALDNGTAATTYNGVIDFTGENSYLQSYSSLALTGGTGGSAELIPTTTSVTILGNVTNQETSFTGHFDTLQLDGTSSGNAINGAISDSSGYASVGNGDTRITKSNSSTWTLSGTNTYHGPTTITGGTLRFQGSGALPSATAITLGTASLQIRNDGAGSGGTISLGNAITLSGSVTGTIDTGNNGSSNTANTAAFGALNNGTAATTYNGVIDFTGENSYLQSYSSLALTGGTGGSAELIPTTTSVTILGNVTNQETSFTGHFDTLQLDGTSTGNAINGIISDSSGYISVNNGDTRITKSNTSTWTLAGTNTYSGPTTITGGTLQIGSSGSLGSTAIAGTYAGTIAISSGAKLEYSSSAAQILSGTVNGAGGLTKDTSTGSTLTLTGTGITFSGPTLISAGTLTLAGGAPGTYASSTTTVNSGGILQWNVLSGSNVTTMVANTSYTGTGIIEKTGAGILGNGNNAVNANMAAGGEMDIQAGDINFGGSHTFESSNLGSLNVAAGATYHNSDATFQADALTGSGGINNAYNNSAPVFTVGVSGTTNNAAYGVTNNTAVFYGNIGYVESYAANGGVSIDAGPGNGSLSLVKVGSGTQILAGTDNYLNSTTIKAGILQFAAPSALYNGAISTSGWTRTNITVNSGATLAVNVGGASDFTAGNVATLLSGVGGTVNNNGFEAGSTIGFDTTNATPTFTLSTVIANTTGTGGGAIGVVKLGANTLALAGSNTYTGPTAINAGTLQIASTGSLGSGSYAGSIVNGGTLEYSSSTPQTLSGIISGTGSLTLDTSANTLTLTGPNTYTGATNINAGTLMTDTAGINATSGIAFGGGTLKAYSAGIITNKPITASSTILADTSNAPITLGANIPGTSAGLTLSGSNILTLSGSDAYTGATTINSGTLNITGALTATSGVTIVSGATLTGSGNNATTGIINAAVNNLGGGAINLTAADSTKSLTINGLTIGNPSPSGFPNDPNNYTTLNYVVGVGGIEALNVGTPGNLNGILTVNSGGAVVSITGSPLVNTLYTLANFGTSSTGIGNFTLSSSTAGQTSLQVGVDTYTLIENATSLQLEVTGTPTPTTAYYKGTAGSTAWNDVNTAPTTNWASNLAGSVEDGNTPGAVTDVILNASTQTGAVVTTLGVSTTINSLTVNGNGTNTINADGSTLTINAAAINPGNILGNAITIGSTANAFTIGTPLVMGNGGANQVWTNNSANTFTVNGSVTGTVSLGNTQTLTLTNTSTGGTTINGAIGDVSGGGQVALVINNTGAGVTTLAGVNTYTGSTSLTAGNVSLTGTLGSGFAGGTAITAAGAFSETTAGIITGSSSLTITGGMTTLGGSNSYNGATNVNAGTLSLTGTISGTAISSASTFTQSSAGVIAGASSVTVTGGTTTLGGNNSYTGATSVGSAGTLSLTGTLNGTAISSAGTFTESTAGIIAGNVTLNVTGGTTTLAGANTYTGATTISGGTLTLQGAAFSTQARSYSISSGAVLSLSGLGGSPGSGTSEPTGATSFSGAGTLQIAGGSFNQNTGAISTINMSLGSGGLVDIQAGASMQNGGWQNINWGSNLATLNVNGTFDIWDGQNVTVDALTGSGNITKGIGNAKPTLIVGANNGTGVFSGNIANPNGSIAFTKNGSGTQTLSGTNTYSGATTINGGILQFKGGSALPSATAISLGAATLQIRNDGAGSNGTISVGNNITLSNSVTATIDTGNNGSANTGNTVAFGALNNGTSANALGSTINFTGENGYLQSFSGFGLPGSTGNTTVLVPTTTSVTITGNIINQETSFTTHFDTMQLDGTSSGNVISGNISDSSGYASVGNGDTRITKTNTSIWTLSGVNTYHGPTTITGGTLQFDGNSSLPGASAVNLGAATLQIRNDGAGGNGTISVGNSITLSNSVTATIDTGNNGSANTGNTVAFGALSNGTSANAFSSTIDFTGENGYLQSYSSLGLSGSGGQGTTLVPTTTSVTITGNVTNQETSFTSHFDTLQLDGTSTGNVINGVISDSSGYVSVGNGDTRITKSNASTWTLNGANTYSGPTTITGGTLQIGSSGSLGIANNYADTIAISSGATFQYSSSAAQTLSGIISGAGAVTKDASSAGILNLTASNTYAGGTTVNAGTLLVNNTSGSGTGTNSVTVNGGRLGGTGTVGNGTNVGTSVTINAGGTISPGPDAANATVGTLNTGDQTWNGGTYIFKTSVATNPGQTYATLTAGANPQDFLVINGNLDIVTGIPTPTPFTISIDAITGAMPTIGSTFTIAYATNIYTETTVGGLQVPVTSGTTFNFPSADFSVPDNYGNVYDVSIVADASGPNGGGYDVNVTVAPEPNSIGLLGVASLGLLRRRRTNRK